MIHDEPTDRQRALAQMVAMDEEMEAEHPGWMTGSEPDQSPAEIQRLRKEGE